MGERDYLAEKRSAIRSRIAKPKGVENKKIIGGVLALVLVFGLVFASYSGEKKISQQEKAAPQTQKQAQAPSKPAPEPQDKEKVAAALSPASEKKPTRDILAPKITIRSPPNAAINDSTPLLDVYVEGEGIDTVWISVDDGPNLTISHNNGTINYVRLNPLFADDFSGKVAEWKKAGENWNVGANNIVMITKVTPLYNNNIDLSSRIGLIGQKNPTGNPSDWSLLFTMEKNIKKLYFLEEAVKWGNSIDFDWQLNTPYYMKMEIDENTVRGKAWKVGYPEPEWMITDRFKNKLLNGYVGLYSRYAKASFDDIVVYQHLLDGKHSVTVYANNTVGNVSATMQYFTIKTIKKSYGIRDTLTKGSFAVTLNWYSPIEEVTHPRASVGLYAMAYITVENVGKVEKDVKFDSKTVLLDDLGNQYIFKTLKRNGEIVQGTLYPGGKKSGKLYFTPAMSLEAKNVKLIISLGGEKYEFEFKAF